ncbi:PQQ-binding-like beta-propeller repeat protein [Halomicrococcus sp. NG-SE-24]|uniref:outer membrane protein assembly factor BamB family protein n=1 Tax=Halomicrococcus sp. NG-SE-24 TaxID=3436928 RepID=UPI003D96D39E
MPYSVVGWRDNEHPGSDRRTFLKRFAIVVPLGQVGESTWLDAGPLTATVQSTDDAWPMFGHDPAHTGVNPDATGPEPPAEVKWHVSDLPGSVWPPAVVGDTAYVGTGFFDQTTDGDLRAFSVDRGTNQWVFVPSEPGMGVPAIVDGTIYIGGNDNNVNALDVETKELRWTFTANAPTTFPKVVDGMVYVTEFGGRFTVYAIDAENGEEQWRFEAATGPAETVAVADDRVYVGPFTSDSTVYAIDAESGEEQWRFEAAVGAPNTPVVTHDTVYVGSDDSNVYAVDAASGEEQWRFNEPLTPFRVPVVDDDTVYVNNSDTNLYALDASTGDPRWLFEGATSEIFVRAVGGETVYIGGHDMNVYAVDTTSGEEQWRFEAATEPTGSPVAVGETLYVGTLNGSLYALT